MHESLVGFAGLFLATGASIGLDDIGHIVVVFGGQTEELQPVFRGDELDVCFGDVAHEQELAFEEPAFHLIGLDSQEPREAAHRLGV